MTFSNSAAPPRVFLAALYSDDSAALAVQLGHYLAQHSATAPAAFSLQACSLVQLLELPMAAKDAVLLMAPPLSARAADASQAHATQQVHETADAQTLLMHTRLQLVARGQAFQLLFSEGQRLKQEALAALCNWFPNAEALQALRMALRAANHGARAGWSCEKCSDPDCELRLFQDLLAPQKN
ncbi:hypothetical protein HS961_12955 [Comamonas piscis]|uniref:Uncharacterized protein n=1 Tax=Comamonas piscis TaxID=1562974 RepID=A0A7G5EI36_9BURK|nr:hypothetical protein [Comamonas piscis]QMV73661.1 hypothetical protein HS961_12955 [Comamonas piscis]WSO32083.1 hypothetical protein VUJ63_12990 [Comamonas piscis]